MFSKLKFWGNDDKESNIYNKDWRKDHCDLLGISTGKLDQAKAEEFLKQAQEAREKIEEAQNQMVGVIQAYGQELLLEGGAALVKQAAWSKIRGAMYVGGGAVIGGVGGGIVGNVPGAVVGASYGAEAGAVLALIHAGVNAYDAVIATMDGKELYNMLSTQAAKWEETLGKLDPLKKHTNADGTIDQKGANTFLADLQDAMATANACTRARKCNIIPKSTLVDKETTRHGLSEKADNHGCCKGQTGHHVLSHAMIKDAGCKDYSNAKAPTVCVEGYSQHFGSHQRIHSELSSQLGKKLATGKVASDNTMSLDDGIDAAVKSHMHTFIASMCDPRCTRAT